MWEWDIDTIKLNPILDPLAIIVNMINKEEREVEINELDRKKYVEINNSSILNNMEIIFFRHQHILKILKSNIIILK